MSDKSKKDKDKPPAEPDRSTPDALDPGIVKWLARLFIDDERADFVYIQQRHGRNARDGGAQIATIPFKIGEKPSMETLVEKANEIVEHMQNEADQLRRTRTFALVAHNKLRGGSFAERIITIEPKRLLVGGGKNGMDEEDEDNPFYQKGGDILRERYTAAAMDLRYYFEQTTSTLGAMMQGLMDQNRELMSQNRELFNANMQLARTANEAQNNALDRELAREDKRVIVEMKRKGMSLVAGLLPGVVSKLTNGNVSVPGGKTPEAMTIEAVMESLSPEEGILLIGEWNEGKCMKPGLLTEAQVRILGGVSEGQITPDQLDRLIEGGDQEFTKDQQQALFQSGIDLEKLMPLMGLVKDRLDKRAKQTAAK